MNETPVNAKPKTGLVLTGGGARAAYQVGVLKAIDELLAMPEQNPFHIVCGTSAGALNAATLAVFSDNFSAAVQNLRQVWENMRAHHVFRATPLGTVVKGLAHWGATMLPVLEPGPISLLDNAPLQNLVTKSLDFSRIQENIDAGALYAVSITCSGYSSGESVSFYQGGPGLEAWERTQRIGCATPLGAEHLMASSALPFIFPAVKINREFFGDGSMRQIAPISPALHLGADRVLVIGTGRPNAEVPRVRAHTYPSLAQIAGHAMNSIFLDSLSVDIERMQRINRTISLIPEEKAKAAGLSLRKVEVLVMSPSQSIERMAPRFLSELPWAARFMLRGVGAMSRSGSNLASYLLFESGFCRALIDLGYQDTMVRRTEVLEFLGAAN